MDREEIGVGTVNDGDIRLALHEPMLYKWPPYCIERPAGHGRDFIQSAGVARIQVINNIRDPYLTLFSWFPRDGDKEIVV
jgi:hypothetical protein